MVIRIRWISVLGLLVALSLPVPARSETAASPAASEPLRLDALIEQVLAHNPELQAARKRWEAAQKRPGQERSLPDPNIGLGWSAAGAPYPGAGLGTEMSANVGVTLSQMLPFPGKLGLRGGIAEKEATAESFLFTGAGRNLVARCKTAFYELQYIYEALDVLDRNRTLLERLAQSVRIRYESGEAAQQDLIKAQLEITLLETRALELERLRQGATAEINALLNQDVASPLARPEPPTNLPDLPFLPSFEALQSSALQSAPEIRAQRSVIDGRQLALELARRESYPDFEVMGGYFNQGSMKDMWEFRVQMNLPIFSANKRRLAVEEAAAGLGEVQKSYRASEQAVSFQLRDQYLEAENAHKLMELYAVGIIPQASLALESSLLNYGAGKLDFLSVFANFTAILENEINYCKSRAQYLQALARLEELAGGL
ncbi:MAG: TolC family protein [Acidobacteriota bacterium]|jgi:outer membrane protein TolC|nr:TolC family protein [Acidobacteriota bacterium]